MDNGLLTNKDRIALRKKLPLFTYKGDKVQKVVGITKGFIRIEEKRYTTLRGSPLGATSPRDVVKNYGFHNVDIFYDTYGEAEIDMRKNMVVQAQINIKNAKNTIEKSQAILDKYPEYCI